MLECHLSHVLKMDETTLVVVPYFLVLGTNVDIYKKILVNLFLKFNNVKKSVTRTFVFLCIGKVQTQCTIIGWMDGFFDD